MPISLVVPLCLTCLVFGLVVGYRLKSASAHEAARRRRLNARQRATAAALGDLPPRVSTADIRSRTDKESRTSG